MTTIGQPERATPDRIISHPKDPALCPTRFSSPQPGLVRADIEPDCWVDLVAELPDQRLDVGHGFGRKRLRVTWGEAGERVLILPKHHLGVKEIATPPGNPRKQLQQRMDE